VTVWAITVSPHFRVYLDILLAARALYGHSSENIFIILLHSLLLNGLFVVFLLTSFLYLILWGYRLDGCKINVRASCASLTAFQTVRRRFNIYAGSCVALALWREDGHRQLITHFGLKQRV